MLAPFLWFALRGRWRSPGDGDRDRADALTLSGAAAHRFAAAGSWCADHPPPGTQLPDGEVRVAPSYVPSNRW